MLPPKHERDELHLCSARRSLWVPEVCLARLPVPGPRPGWAVHRIACRSPGRRWYRGREDPPRSPRECSCEKVRAHGPDGGHRLDADLRPATPAVHPGPSTWPTTTDDDPSQPPAPPAPARPPCRRPLPGADQAPTCPRRPYQRLRAGRIEATVKTGGRVLDPTGQYFSGPGSWSGPGCAGLGRPGVSPGR